VVLKFAYWEPARGFVPWACGLKYAISLMLAMSWMSQNRRPEAKQLQDRLWATAVANARKDMNSDVAALYIESLNDIVNVHALRVAVGIQSRVEPEVWFVLFVLIGLGAMVVGYQTAIAESGRSMIQPILAASFALVIALIASLDRPDSGVMRVTQRPLIDLQNSMSAAAGSADPGAQHP
jgi:hypothetical protein